MCFDISEVNVAEKQEEKVVHVKYEYFSSTRTQTVRPFHFFGIQSSTCARKKRKRRTLWRKKWLILGCINADFGNHIVILQHFSRSTRFAYFCTARNSIFWRNLSKFSRILSKKFEIFDKFLKMFWQFWIFSKNLISERCKSMQIL